MSFFQESQKVGSSTLYFIFYQAFEPLEYIDFLTTPEQERFFGLKSTSRKREFMATRYLRHQIFGPEHIHYDSFGAPYIKGEGYISISHAPGIAGIAFNPLFSVGLDIELRSLRALQVCAKFLSDEEQRLFNTNDADAMTKAWCAKETLYKIAGRKQLNFRSELLLRPGNDQTMIGQIQAEHIRSTTQIHTFVKDTYIFSINGSALSVLV